MYDDAAAAYRLGGAVVVDDILYAVDFIPNLDPEGVGTSGACVIGSPHHKLVFVAVGVQRSIIRARALELGVEAALIQHQPFVGGERGGEIPQRAIV